MFYNHFSARSLLAKLGRKYVVAQSQGSTLLCGAAVNNAYLFINRMCPNNTLTQKHMRKHLRVCLAQDMISHFPKSRQKGHISSIQQVRMLRYTLFKNDTDKHDKPCPNMHVDIKQDKKNNRSVECSTTLFKNDTDKHDKLCPNMHVDIKQDKKMK